MRDFEHAADEKKRELWRTLRDAFTTPLDAEDLYSLSAGLDTVLNGAKNIVRESDVLSAQPDAAGAEMASHLAEGIEHLAEAFERLGTHDGDATVSADAAVKSERKLEHAYRRAMSALLEVDDLRVVMAHREIYRRYTHVGDSLVAVAERVWYAVVKEA